MNKLPLNLIHSINFTIQLWHFTLTNETDSTPINLTAMNTGIAIVASLLYAWGYDKSTSIEENEACYIEIALRLAYSKLLKKPTTNNTQKMLITLITNGLSEKLKNNPHLKIKQTPNNIFEHVEKLTKFYYQYRIYGNSLSQTAKELNTGEIPQIPRILSTSPKTSLTL